MLEREAAAANVRTLLGTTVISVSRDSHFRVETSAGLFTAASLVVATGGLSIPKMGATGLGYTLAEQFGLHLVPTRPALVPLVFHPEDRDRWCDLTGLSAEAVATTTAFGRHKPAFRRSCCSPIAASAARPSCRSRPTGNPANPIALDLAPGHEVTAPLLEPNTRRDSATALQALKQYLPARMAERWLTLHPPANWTNAGLAAFESGLLAWTVTPAGTEGYAKAEVTAGGVDTAELDARTLQSRKVPGLYFIGEVVDVSGWLGGYNFQWAWASGVSAGQSA